VTEPVAVRPGPVPPDQRIELLDVLRGFALYGVLVVNWERTSGGLELGIQFLADGSFYSIFSMLFGLGFTIQLARAEAGGRPFAVRYLWRSAILLAIGLLHFIFLYNEDILRRYALDAVVLLLARRWPPRRLLMASALLLLFYSAPPSIIPPPGTVWRLPDLELSDARRVAPEAVESSEPPSLCTALPGLTTAYRTDVCLSMESSRTLLTQSVFDVRFWQREAGVLAMFLLGAWVGRRGVIREAGRHTALLAAAGVTGLVLGVLGNATELFGLIALPSALTGWQLEWAVGSVGLAVFYMCGLGLIWTHAPRIGRVLALLSGVGRMALTNYLMQSVICGLLLERIFAVLGRMTGWQSVALLTIVFALQVVSSRWWLQRYQFGPAEWLWRSLVWWRKQPMMAASPSSRA
jgi:uncharacterized protein